MTLFRHFQADFSPLPGGIIFAPVIRMRVHQFLITVVVAVLLVSAPVFAQTETPPPPMDYAKRAALYDIARRFVTKVTQGFDAADAAMGMKGASRNAAALTPEGPMIFNVTLGKRQLPLETMINVQGRGGKVYVSLADYFAALEFPIIVDAKAGTAEGWYIREDNRFTFDLADRTVKASKNKFTLSDAVTVEDGQIFVSPEEVAHWFGFETHILMSQLEIQVTAPRPLPVEERLARKNRSPRVNPNGPPQFPLMVEGASSGVSYPIVGVTSRYSYTQEGDTGEKTTGYSSNVLTRGDFLKGRLETESQFNDKDKLTSVRASYVRESLEPELLGPLKARRYQLGNLTSVRMPVGRHVYQGAGARVSNIDPARVFTQSATGISGNAPPGWDVELYRGSQFIESRTTGDDGFYHFDSVNLFRSNNNFRVMLYGPQGEIREQTVSIPVDPYRLSESGSAYDVSLSFDDTQLYRKEASDSEKAPRLSAIYEKPVSDNSAVSVGLTSGIRSSDLNAKKESERIHTLHGGASTTIGPVLFNAGAALESTGEVGAELVARADYGKHQFRNELNLASDGFAGSGNGDTSILEDTLTVTGPFPVTIGRNPRYNLSLNYGLKTDDSYGNVVAGYSGAFGRVSLNQQFRYGTTGDAGEDSLYSETGLRGALWNTYIRGDVSYKLMPENEINDVTFNVQRPLRENLDFEVEHRREPENEFSENRLQLNWRAAAATISPSITRNSEGDTIAYLNTSFSAMRSPDGKIRFSNQVLGSSGLLSARVFLDKNGNGTWEEGEDPIPDVTIVLPQNGGQTTTDKDGYARINHLQNFKRTDVYIQPDSLADPFWLPASKGMSILPRIGHVTEVNLPVVMGGQLEGNVFMKDNPSDDAGHLHAELLAARGVTLSLYNVAGEKTMTTRSEEDGYYIFSPVAPGDYMLVVDDTGQPASDFSRPEPMAVKIGHGGVDVSGQNIYLTPGADVPMRMIETATIEKQEPALDAKTLDGKSVVLNLGVYNSRVLMGLVWFKTQKQAGGAVAGLTPLVDPSASYADTKTGEHTLRIGARGLTMKAANDRCRVIVSAGMSCTVEVLPGGMVVADAAHAIAK